MIALCDKCNRVTNIAYKTKQHPNSIKETYFKCDQCHYHFTCFVTDKRVRKLQQKRDELNGQHNAVKRQRIQEDINNRMKQLKYNLVNYGRADLGGD
ncbi:hypothetical protein RVS70_07490 [Virgibacillus sp. M23]|uniref:hypothetical protein n=1 Tax=Virgibacillus sp. M23 TaxID=3079030 RepID=UPI002A919A6C|nr:hypothetical protein [Virgibacillus sp. M23]MDY7044048.1 hypothetical protein [Virgibacillus sp. M23]